MTATKDVKGSWPRRAWMRDTPRWQASLGQMPLESTRRELARFFLLPAKEYTSFHFAPARTVSIPEEAPISLADPRTAFAGVDRPD